MSEEKKAEPWYKDLTPFKDVFVLKRNSWHLKLMKTIWGYDEYDFPNMCPYFWLTVLNVIISPFYFLFKYIGLGFYHVFGSFVGYLSDAINRYNRYCDEKSRKWREDIRAKVQKQIEDEKNGITTNNNYLFELFKVGDIYKYKSNVVSEKVWDSISYSQRDTLIEMYSAKYKELIRLKREREENENEEKRQAEIARKKMIGKISIFSKYVVKVLGIIAAGVLIWLFYLLVMWIASWNWMKIMTFIGTGLIKLGLLILICAVIAAVVVGILSFFKWIICKYGTYCIPCYERREKIGNFFLAIGKGIALPFIWLGTGIWYIFKIIRALQKDNCPSIRWLNEDGTDAN